MHSFSVRHVSKKIIERINNTIRNKARVNQRKNSASVIEWFKEIPNKSRHTFLSFDIDNFYPSISVDLLRNAIDYAKKNISISEQDINIIMYARKSLLFKGNTAWVKKGNTRTERCVSVKLLSPINYWDC